MAIKNNEYKVWENMSKESLICGIKFYMGFINSLNEEIMKKEKMYKPYKSYKKYQNDN
ncbi:MAG: hypothetical protein ACOCVF_04355 [bacterium]